MPAVALAAIAFAALVAVPAIGVTAASTPAPSSGQSSGAEGWAFGNATIVPVQGHDVRGAYEGNASYGFVTNITAVNTTANTTEVIEQDTIGLSLSLEYCRPNCSAPSQVSRFSYRAWEVRDAWTNVTNNASVLATSSGLVTATWVTAVGILNSSSTVRELVNESASDTRTGATTPVSSLNATYAYNSSSRVAFTPALGLFPTGAVVAQESWVASAAYTASASWAARWALNATGSGANSSVGSSQSLLRTSTGNLTIAGAAGPSGVRVHAVRLLSLDYTLGGHFTLGPGPAVSLSLPGSFGMGLPPTSGWAAHSLIQPTVEVSALGASPNAGGFYRLQSSEVAFSLRFLDPNNDGVNDTTPQTQVAGGPMTPSQASSTASCLQQSAVCSTVTSVGGNGGLTSSSETVLVVTLSVTALAVVLAVVVVARQRRIPPPQYPNAGLYPPGQPVSPGPSGPSEPKPPRTPSGPADDPLDQLW